MESYLIYIGKSALAAGAFYLAYLALFQNQKQFVFNRVYLPVSFVLSFVIPLITFTTIKYIEPAEPVHFDFNSFAYLPEVTEIAQPQFVYQWHHYLIGIYILGAASFFFYLLLGHIKASNIIRFSRSKQLFGTQVNITPKDVHPFSFFNKIVLSEKTLQNLNLEVIICHEKIHVKEKHTFDILFAEILFLFQWFNPFAWLIKDAIKNNLEYKTDNQVTQQNNAEAYQLAMVGLADKKGVAPFLTALNGSQLKNRIVMMKKKKENKYAFLKQLVVLPLLAILVMGLSNKEITTEIVQPSDVPLNQLQEERAHYEKVIKGNVTDENGEPIKGASVIIKGKPFGTITDKSGNYSLNTEEQDKILLFRFLDISEEEVEINDRDRINVSLKTNVKPKKRETLISGNTYEGTLKLRNSQGEMVAPLFIIDGKEVKKPDNLTPNDIVSTSILTNESAEIYYGEKGKNGVVQIATTNWKFSLNANPLIIVDGEELIGSIEDIPKDKIYQVTELRYPNLTQNYGDKGKDGVVIIRTTRMQAVGPLISNEKRDSNHFASFKSRTDLNSIEKNEQQYKIRGKVTNKKGAVIPGASVIIKGTTSGTVTDKNGNYRLLLEDGNVTLMFIMVGFEKKEVLVENKTEINVKLTPDKKDNDVITITTTSSPKIDAEQIKKYGGEVFYKVEEMPQFPGGDKALKKYIENSIKYPEIAIEKGIQGKVYVSFIIDKNGKVNDPKIVRGVDPVLDKEAMRVVSTLPKFKPGKQQGKIVNTSYTVPVDFTPTLEHLQEYRKVGLDGKPLKKEYSHSIRGKVTDAQGAAIPGVSVIIKGINAGTITDKEGYYVLKYDSAIETVIFAIKGQTKKEIKVDGKTVINVVLESESDPKSGETKASEESEHSSVRIQNTGFSSKFDENPPLFIIDGKISDKNGMENLDPNKINDITVLKDASAISLYGEQAKDGVIIINTKGNTGTRKGELPVVLNGKMTQLTLNEVDRNLIKNISRIEPEEAMKKYGEKGKYGVYEVTSRKVYTDKVEIKSTSELAKENIKITTPLELRKFIAENIKYPVLAQKANREKTVKLLVQIDKKGKITSIEETEKYNKIKLDEVVVVAYADKEIVATAYGTKAEAENAKKIQEQLLVDETKRVINKIPQIEIPEFNGEKVQIAVKFMLQD